MQNISLNDTLSYQLSNQTAIDGLAIGVGIGYITAGVIFIFLQISCAYLIMSDKKMQNPTYMLVVNLSITDAIELMPLGLYGGVTIILPCENPTLEQWMAFVCLTAWYSNCILFAYISFSRWIAITRPELMSVVFSRNVMRFLHASAWVPFCLHNFFTIAISTQPLFIYLPEIFTWSFNLKTRLGETWHWINFGINTFMSTVEMTFNILALIHVHKTRKQVQTIIVSNNHRREVKLLIQCFIIGCVFAAANIMFTLAYALGWKSRGAFLCMQSTWTFNHCVNPLVYFSVNTELRKSFWKLVTFKKCCGKHSATVAPQIECGPLPIADVRRTDKEARQD